MQDSLITAAIPIVILVYFINLEKWQVGGEFRVALVASRAILPNEELTYDYRFSAFGQKQKCLCGSRYCRSFIGENKKSNQKEEDAKRLKKEQRESQPKKRRVAKEKPHDESCEIVSNRMYIGELGSNLKEIVKYRSFYRDTGLMLVRNLNDVLLKEYSENQVSNLWKNAYRRGVPKFNERTRQRSLDEVVERLRDHVEDEFVSDQENL